MTLTFEKWPKFSEPKLIQNFTFFKLGETYRFWWNFFINIFTLLAAELKVKSHWRIKTFRYI